MHNLNIKSFLVRAVGALTLLLLGYAVLLVVLVVGDLSEHLETVELQKAELRIYQLELTVEEIVLTSDSRSLSGLEASSGRLHEDLSAIYDGDPSYLYCVIQDTTGQVLFQDAERDPPPAIHELVGGDWGEYTKPVARKFTHQVSGEERAFFQVSTPLVIQGRFLGFLKLGISRQLLSEQLNDMAAMLVGKHLVGVVLILAIVALAAFQAARLIRRARFVEAEIRETDRLIFLGTIAGGLAHEIRNPLNAIYLDSELLAEEVEEKHEKLGEEAVKLSRKIAESVQYLEATLSSFLRFARPADLNREPTDLSRLVSDTIRFVEAECAQRDIEIMWNKPDDVPDVWVDGAQIKQALLNLLLNAQQAMPQGGILAVGLRNAGGRIRLVVSDTGPGIAEEDQEKIFNVFHSTRAGGSGLGLPIARRIVEEHGGRLDVSSKPGHGAHFSLFLDAGPPQGG